MWVTCFQGKSFELGHVGVSDLGGMFFEDLTVQAKKGPRTWSFRWAVRCRGDVLQVLSPIWLKAIAASSYRMGRSARGSYTSASNWRASEPTCECPSHPIRPAVFFLTRPVFSPGDLPRVAEGRSALHELARVALSEPDSSFLSDEGRPFVETAVDRFARDPLAFARFVKATGYVDSILSVLTPSVEPTAAFQRDLLAFVRGFPPNPNGPRSDESLDAFLNGPRSTEFVPLVNLVGGIVTALM